MLRRVRAKLCLRRLSSWRVMGAWSSWCSSSFSFKIASMRSLTLAGVTFLRERLAAWMESARETMTLSGN